MGIVEGMKILDIRTHHLDELVNWNAGVQVDEIALKITGVDLGGSILMMAQSSV